jgi:hypothetical protein
MILAVVWSWGTNNYPEIENPLYRYQKLETILPETRNMTNADCLALLMGDDPPQEIENLLYRFLTSLFRRRLGILAAQGEGL